MHTLQHPLLLLCHTFNPTHVACFTAATRITYRTCFISHDSKQMSVWLDSTMQVTQQCQERGNLMADLWHGLCSLTVTSVASCEASQLASVQGLATAEALQCAMPVVRDQYTRQVLAAQPLYSYANSAHSLTGHCSCKHALPYHIKPALLRM